MDRRVELDHLLRTTLDSDHVYFQPPASVKLQYPCIIYKLNSVRDTHANDKTYLRMKQYQMIYITKEPDDPMQDTLNDLQYCTMVQQPYASDNLYHFVYNIYY